MPTANPRPAQADPLEIFLRNAEHGRGQYPVPLISTRYDLKIDAGLAVVTATRVFQNSEPLSIEATMTFPMPVRAVLFELTARLDGRILKAIAMEPHIARPIHQG